MSHQRIAIAGGGFSGSMLAVQLVRQSPGHLAIDLFNETEKFAQGAAYGTADMHHLLNVTAARMSALPDEPRHLLDWLETRAPEWQAALPELKNARYDEGSFIPRALYALYLEELLREAIATAPEKHIVLMLHAFSLEKATARGDGWQLQAGEKYFDANQLVLATGNPPARPFMVEGTAGSSRYIAHLWSKAGKAFLARQDFTFLADSVVIIGTGLSMVDAVLTLRAGGLTQPIIAISRHASLPMPHAPAYLPWHLQADLLAAKTLSERLRLLRKEIKIAAQQSVPWQAVVDALRPLTLRLWQTLDLSQKKTFLRHGWNIWNIHRHRMPPGSHATLTQMQNEGSLSFFAGKIEMIEASESDYLTLHWRAKNGANQQTRASIVLNCTGPEMQLSRIANPLLKSLLEQIAITAHPLGIGAAANANGALLGDYQKNLFTIGPLLLGERLETTAVPELRQQAQDLAAILLHKDD